MRTGEGMVRRYTAETLAECIEMLRRDGLKVWSIRRAYRWRSAWNLEAMG